MILDDPTTTDIEFIPKMPLARLRPHPHNPRHTTEDDQPILDLADSIRAQGVIEPIIAIPDPTDHTLTGEPGQYLIVAGHRRARASEIAEQATIPAIIRHDLTNPAEIEMWMLVENGQRQDLDPIAEATAIERLVTEHGVAQRTLSKELGRSQSHISKRLALLKLGEGLRTAVCEGRIGLELATQIAGLPAEKRHQLETQSSNERIADRAQDAIDDERIVKQLDLLRKEAAATGLPEYDPDLPRRSFANVDGPETATHWRIYAWQRPPRIEWIHLTADGPDKVERVTATNTDRWEARRAAEDALREQVEAACDHLRNQGAPKPEQMAEFIARFLIERDLDDHETDALDTYLRRARIIDPGCAPLDDDEFEAVVRSELAQGRVIQIAYYALLDELARQVTWRTGVRDWFLTELGITTDDDEDDDEGDSAGITDTPDIATYENVAPLEPATSAIITFARTAITEQLAINNEPDHNLEALAAELDHGVTPTRAREIYQHLTNTLAEPWHNYNKSAANPLTVLAKIDDADRVEHVLAYERANRARPDVIAAAQQRLDELTRAAHT